MNKNNIINTIFDSKLNCNINYVFCIDITGDMNKSFDNICEFIENTCNKVKEVYNDFGRDINTLNIKLVLYKDLEYDDNAIQESKFYNYYLEKEDLFKYLTEKSLINGELMYGGDLPESTLEALYVSMNSDWPNTDNKSVNKNTIVLFTNSEYKINDEKFKDMPNSVEELKNYWENNLKIRKSSKRIIIFGPEHIYSEFEEFYGTTVINKENIFEFEDFDIVFTIKYAMSGL